MIFLQLPQLVIVETLYELSLHIIDLNTFPNSDNKLARFGEAVSRCLGGLTIFTALSFIVSDLIRQLKVMCSR